MEKMQLIEQGKLEDCDNLEDAGGHNATKRVAAGVQVQKILRKLRDKGCARLI